MVKLIVLVALLIVCVFASFGESKSNSRWFRGYVKRQENSVKKDACLAKLNEIRKEHGAGPVKWDSYLEEHAVPWANHLSKTQSADHDPQEENSDNEGENIYLGKSGSPADCVTALGEWAKQERKYRAETKGCKSPPEVAIPGTEEFTHMVWKDADVAAVAVVKNVVVARFFPPGNFEEEFGEQVECGQ